MANVLLVKVWKRRRAISQKQFVVMIMIMITDNDNCPITSVTNSSYVLALLQNEIATFAKRILTAIVSVFHLSYFISFLVRSFRMKEGETRFS